MRGPTLRAAARAGTRSGACSRRWARARPHRAPNSRHRDDADAAGLRGTADVVAERDGGVLHLAPLGLALQLLVILVDHAHAGGARRVSERLQAAVGVDG